MGLFDNATDLYDQAGSATGYGRQPASPKLDTAPSVPGPIDAYGQAPPVTMMQPRPGAMPEGVTQSLVQPATGAAYDPDAGAIVPQADMSGINRGIRGAVTGVGNAIQSTFQQMGANTGTGYQAPQSAPQAESVAESATRPRVPAPISNAVAQSTTPLGYPPEAPVAAAASSSPVSTYGQPQQPQQPNADDLRMRQIQSANITGATAALEQRQIQERNQQQVAQANAAGLSMDAQRAAGEARVARWRATNGADMVLGSPGLYKAQRQGIIAAAGQADAANLAAQGASQKANAALGQPLGNPIQDQASTTDTMLKGEEAINRRGEINRRNTATDLANQLTGQQVEHGKTTQTLLARLADPSLTPKDRQAAQTAYLTALGKDPAQYKVEHSNGPPVLDSLGQLHPGPQYVHIVNTTNGEVQTMKNEPAAGTAPGAGRTPSAEHKAMLKSDPKKYSAMFDEAYGPGAAAAALGSK